MTTPTIHPSMTPLSSMAKATKSMDRSSTIPKITDKELTEPTEDTMASAVESSPMSLLPAFTTQLEEKDGWPSPRKESAVSAAIVLTVAVS